jgi:hypothetical protein
MKQITLALIVYVFVNSPGGIVKTTFSGMTQDDVEQMLQERNVSYTIVSQKEFDAQPERIEALQSIGDLPK